MSLCTQPWLLSDTSFQLADTARRSTYDPLFPGRGRGDSRKGSAAVDGPASELG
jgi:hypothetical protein